MTLTEKIEVLKQRAKKLDDMIVANRHILNRNFGKSQWLSSSAQCGQARALVSFFTYKQDELLWVIAFLESPSPNGDAFLKHGIES